MKNTQKTLDKQTATFVAALTQNVPSLSAEQMQFFIENPTVLQQLLTNLQPTMCGFMQRIGLVCHVEFIELQPGWDFLILRSTYYPEVGMAVSNYDGSLGKGLHLAIKGKKDYEGFTAPCACCNWTRHLDQKEAAQKVRTACIEKGIKFLLINCWASDGNLEQDKDGLRFINPYQSNEMQELDGSRFMSAFGWIKHMNGGHVESLATLFEKK